MRTALGKAISVLWIIVIQPLYHCCLGCSVGPVWFGGCWKMALSVQCFLVTLLLLGANGKVSVFKL